MKLTLTANSVRGIDTYSSKFKDLCLKLEESGNLDLQKVTIFLDGIKDYNYSAYNTVCYSEN